MHRRPLGLVILASIAALACGGTASRDPGGSPDLVVPIDLPTPDVPEAADDADAADVPADVADAADGADASPEDTLDACTLGGLKGLVCTPNELVLVAYAKVTLDVTGPCTGGKTVHLETTADAKGAYEFANVPPGPAKLWYEKGSFKMVSDVDVPPGVTLDIRTSGKRCFAPAAASIAVIKGDSDDIGALLDDLGFKHDDYETGNSGTVTTSTAYALLNDPAKLATYDILFINCSGTAQAMIEKGGSFVPANLKAFVEAGKSLYASDWAWAYVEWAWPSAVEFAGSDKSWSKGDGDGPDKSAGPRQGPGPTLTEKNAGAPAYQIPSFIVDMGLANAIGTIQTTIYEDLGTWVVVDSVAGGTVHVQGVVTSDTGATWGTKPLVVSFPAGQGRVIFTSFHNIAQDDAPASVADIKAILSYLVFEL